MIQLSNDVDVSHPHEGSGGDMLRKRALAFWPVSHPHEGSGDAYSMARR